SLDFAESNAARTVASCMSDWTVVGCCAAATTLISPSASGPKHFEYCMILVRLTPDTTIAKALNGRFAPFVNRVYQPQLRGRSKIIHRQHAFLNFCSSQQLSAKRPREQPASHQRRNAPTLHFGDDVCRGGFGDLLSRFHRMSSH